MLKNNKIILAFISVVMGIVLVASASYFNHQEIGTLTTQCYQHDGTPTLTIHHQLTNDYSFQCKPKEI